MTIRKMRPEDSQRVLEIFTQGIAGGNATFEHCAPAWKAWDADHHQHSRFVAEEGGQVIAWAALKPVSSRACFSGVAEFSIYVDSAAQGQGLGTLLVARIITESETQGIWMLQSNIFPENQASVALHEKMGFRVVGRRERIAEMNGIWRDVLLMERRSATTGA